MNLRVSEPTTLHPASAPRGYALLIVMLAATILAAISVSLVTAASADRMGSRIQMNTVRALYAAESGTSVAIQDLANRLGESTDPDLTAFVPPALPSVTFPDYIVSYVDPSDWSETVTCASDSDCGAGMCAVGGNCQYASTVRLPTGDYAGLTALQTPVQVLVTAEYNSARATVGDVMNLNLIPIFQFAIFFDGDLEFQNPPSMTISGPTHTNGDFVPLRPGTTSTLAFDGRVTVAGEQKRCAIYDGTKCFGAGDSGVTVNGIALESGIETTGTAAAQATYHETTFGDFMQDKHRGVTVLTPPIPLSVTRPDVTSRPDVCGTLTAAESASFEQGIGIHLVRRPDPLYADANYTQVTNNRPWEETYGPSPAVIAPGVGPAFATPCTAATLNQAHCQSYTPHPNIVFSETNDDAAVREQRMYWEADVRIIDGVWRDSNNDIVFDPATFDMSTNASQTLAHRIARVLRYSWFWDPRESRNYPPAFNANNYQRGLQMRVTDFDMQAFDELIDDPAAVSLLFPAGIPSEGITVYLSETFDPTYDDRYTNLDRVSNVRNYLNFHTMEDDAAAMAADCIGRGPGSADNATPCERGWHPHNIWGDGAVAFGGSQYNNSLLDGVGTAGFDTEGSATAGDITAAITAEELASGADLACLDPDAVTSPSPTGTYWNPGTARAPCILATVQPVGPENAVRVIRAQKLPQVGGGAKLGFTLATDNRLYIYGDVNITGAGAQDVAGKVAFVADSVTILSQRFNDTVMQRGAWVNSAVNTWRDTPQLASYPGMDVVGVVATADVTDLLHVNGAGNVDVTAGNAYNAGDGANLCLAWNSLGGVRYRRSTDVSINASLMMGDVPSCAGAGYDEGGSSGGVNNFPRFLEDHSQGNTRRRVVTILGSIVSLFRAEQGNSRFTQAHNDADSVATDWTAPPASTAANSSYNISGNTGCIYNPPTRNWSFDTALETPANLPPSTPRLVNVERVRWVRR